MILFGRTPRPRAQRSARVSAARAGDEGSRKDERYVLGRFA